MIIRSSRSIAVLTITLLAAVFLLSNLVFPVFDALANQTATVTADSVNIRSGPGTSYQITGKVTKGQKLEVIKQSNGWYNVRLSNGQVGWIAGWLVSVQNSQQVAASKTAANKTVIVSASTANIRSGPGLNYSVISYAKAGERFKLVAEQGSWFRIELYNGKWAWISSTVVKVEGAQGTAPKIQAPVSRGGNGSLYGKVIVLDPGHANYTEWGINPGAVGLTGLTEKDVVLDITFKVRNILAAQGAKVIMTHTGTTGLTLAGRANVANNNGADIFVSIHANANTNRAYHGTSTFYHGANSTGLARSIQANLVGHLNTKDLGIMYGNFTVIKNTAMPSVLVETAFISNAQEEALLATDSFRTKAAQGIAAGIQAYFN